MAHDVFISYAPTDKATADAACSALEASGIRCWITSRDTVPGHDKGASIIGAIKNARAMVLIFSASANYSPQVKREVERAVNRGLILIPLRIEEVAPSPALEYLISTPHWLDAYTPPMEQHLQNLTQVISKILGQVPEAAEAGKSVMPAPEGTTPGKFNPAQASGKKGGMVLALVIMFLVALAFAGWRFMSTSHKPATQPAVTTNVQAVVVSTVVTQAFVTSSIASSPVPMPVAATPLTSPPIGRRWINSLGMIFVPVSGTAVMFSIWDTRVQDYQAFVTAKQRVWSKPLFQQGLTHPAVFVNFNDAKAFCDWLTKKERTKGIISDNQCYRLPKDAEWSVAVGLNEAKPWTRENKDTINNIFPWGTSWPPPKEVGNYTQKLNVDAFPNTSPVGSFAANRFGLYDMGGNVWQWCEEVVVRGCSWKEGENGRANSSFRMVRARIFNRDDAGFRCVLANVDASPQKK